MKRLEIIQVRLANAFRDNPIEDIRKSVVSDPCIGSIRFYRQATVATDFSIHIHLETSETITEASNLGARLAAALRDYGMVKHTFWSVEVIDEGQL